MMKWAQKARRETAKVLAAAIMFATVSVPEPVLAEENAADAARSLRKPEVMEVNLGADSLQNPKAAKDASDPWAQGEGNFLYMGRYYQGTDEKQGKSPVKWRVLEAEGDRMFLMADQILDGVRFHEERLAVSWQDSNLYQWLNSEEGWTGEYIKGGFLETAFSKEEQNIILPAEKAAAEPMAPYDNPALSGEKIFLLSAAEAAGQEGDGYGFYRESGLNQTSPVSRALQPTDYAKARGVQQVSVKR